VPSLVASVRRVLTQSNADDISRVLVGLATKGDLRAIQILIAMDDSMIGGIGPQTVEVHYVNGRPLADYRDRAGSPAPPPIKDAAGVTPGPVAPVMDTIMVEPEPAGDHPPAPEPIIPPSRSSGVAQIERLRDIIAARGRRCYDGY
jgi:hypothetical protein